MTKDGFENECSAVGAMWTGDVHSRRYVEAMYTPDNENRYGTHLKSVDLMPPFHDTFQIQLQTELKTVLEMYRAAARRTQDQINENSVVFLLEQGKLTAPEQTKLDDTTKIPDTRNASLKLQARIENLLQCFWSG